MNNGPLKQSERVDALDVLRGFALLGILMVNMPYMYKPATNMLIGAEQGLPAMEVIGESLIKFFFEGKFYVIFSTLFGMGFWYFLNKKREDGKSNVPVYSRRLLILFLFGAAHISLLWAGDILLIYSTLGFALILFRKSSDRKIKWWAILLALTPSIAMALFVGLIGLASQNPQAKAEIGRQLGQNATMMESMSQRAYAAYSSGTFGQIARIRIEEYATIMSGGVLFFCPVVLAMFLAGFLVARRGLAGGYMEHAALFRKLFWWGLCVGMASSATYTYSYWRSSMIALDGWSLLGSFMHMIGGISMGMCYVTGIVLLLISGRGGVLKGFFAPIGRMALTNYLMQSTLCAFLFHPYGLGWFGKVGALQGMMLCVLIYTGQVFFSRWWLARFQFGPMEWLWRSLTYLQIQPMKRG